MSHASRFEPPTIAWRGKVANLRADAQRQRPEHGEKSGTLRCVCGGSIRFTITSNGLSRARCACGVSWCQ